MSNLINNQNPVLIIGESLSGLSTAIGLAQSGLDTTVVKKRAQYTREQSIFINEDRLDFLIDLGVFKKNEVPTFSLSDKKRIIIPIRELEEKLYQRAHELGIKIILGEFKDICPKNQALVKTSNDQEIQVPYSYIVGADGSKSTVRQALKIKCRQISSPTKCASVLLSSKGTHSVEEVEKESYFLRKVSTPQGTFVLLHEKTGSKPTDQEMIIASLRDCGFVAEADSVQEGKSFNITDVAVQLKQAETFCNLQHHALLVGDATATGSFYLGRGGNLALKSAEIAIQFFASMKTMVINDAYDLFNKEMQQITDELISANKYLFNHLLIHTENNKNEIIN